MYIVGDVYLWPNLGSYHIPNPPLVYFRILCEHLFRVCSMNIEFECRSFFFLSLHTNEDYVNIYFMYVVWILNLSKNLPPLSSAYMRTKIVKAIRPKPEWIHNALTTPHLVWNIVNAIPFLSDLAMKYIYISEFIYYMYI